MDMIDDVEIRAATQENNEFNRNNNFSSIHECSTSNDQ